MKIVQAFGCSYCAMTSLRKGSVVRHELITCKNNPNRVCCKLCQHMTFEESEYEHIHVNDLPYYQAPSWFCHAKEVDLNGMLINDNISCDDFISITKIV